MAMSKKQEFYMSVKAILDKTQAKEDVKELQELLSKTPMNFETKDFETAVRKVVEKMSKETLKTIGAGFNAALAELGKETISLDKMIEMPNAKMWQEMGNIAGKYYAQGLQNAVENALKGIDLSKLVIGAGGKANVAQIDDSELNKQIKEIEQKIDNAKTRLKTIDSAFKSDIGKTKEGKISANALKSAKEGAEYFEDLHRNGSGKPYKDNIDEAKAIMQYHRTMAEAMAQGANKTSLDKYHNEWAEKYYDWAKQTLTEQRKKYEDLIKEREAEISRLRAEASGASSASVATASEAPANNVPRAAEKESVAIAKVTSAYDDLVAKVEAYYEARQQMLSLMDKKQPWQHLMSDVNAAKKELAGLFPEKGDKPTDITSAWVNNYLTETLDSKENMLSRLAKDLGIEIPKAAETAETAIEDVKKELTTKQKAELRGTASSISFGYKKGKVSDSAQGEILRNLYANSNFIEELQIVQTELQDKLKPINDATSEISKTASIEGVTWDNLANEAAEAAKQLDKMYDEGIDDAEKFLGLQYKIIKILDYKAESAGGVGGSGAKDRAELNSWIWNSMSEDTGYDFSKTIDILYGQTSNSIYDSFGKLKTMREAAGDALGYGQVSGGLEAKYDYGDLQNINAALRAIDQVVEDFGIDLATLTHKTEAAQAEIKETATALTEETAAREKSNNAQNKPVDKPEAPPQEKIESPKQENVDTTEEVQQLEAVRSKVEDIKTGVEAKTQAFADEEIKVKEVVAAEIEALTLLENKIKNVKELLDGVKAEIPTDTTTVIVEGVNDTPDTSSDVKTELIDADEVQRLRDVEIEVRQITGSIKEIVNNTITENTGLQESINGIVSQIVKATTTERGELGKLNSDIETVHKNITGLFDNITNGKTNLGEALNNVNVTVNYPKTEQNELETLIQTVKNLVDKLSSGTSENPDEKSGDKDSNKAASQRNARAAQRTSVSAAKIYSTVKSIRDAGGTVNAITNLSKVVAKDSTLQSFIEKLNTSNDAKNVSPEDRLQDVEIVAKQLGELQARQDVGGNTELLSPKIKRLEEYLSKKGLSQAEKDAMEKSRSSGYNTQLSELQLSDAVRRDLIIQDELKTLHKQLGDAEGRLAATGKEDEDLSFWIDDLKESIAFKLKLLINPEGVLPELEKIQNKSKNTTIANIKKNEEEDWIAKYDALKEKYERVARLQAEVETTADPEKELQLQRLADEIELEKQKLGLLTEQRIEEYKKLEAAYEAAKVRAEEDLVAKGTKKSLKDQMKDARQEARMSKMTSTWNKGDDALGSLWKMGSIGADTLADLEETKKLQEALKELKRVKAEVKQSTDATGQFDEEKYSKQIKDAIGNVNKYSEAIKELIKNYEFFSDDNSTDLGRKLSPDEDVEEQLVDAATALHGGKIKVQSYDAATQQLTYSIKTGAYEWTNYTAGVRGVDNALRTVQGTTKKTETLFKTLLRKTKDVLTYFSGSTMIYKGIEELKKGIQYIREIDAALTELKKVTDETESSYDRFLNTASKTADKIGSTITSVTLATATFAKLGYEMNLAAEMAEAALVYQNVGDGIESADEAANSIISTMNGFGIEASDAMLIVDRFNQVGNEFQVTSKGLGEALERSASALSESGNTIDEAIGLITAANSVINDTEKVGTALKTLSLRLRGASVELQEAGLDADNMAESTSRLQAKLLALTHGKVDIMLDANTFKNTTQIIREMADAWSEMTDLERAAALELMGGKQQANVLAALIQNFDTAENAIKSSASSAGSALRENEVYLDSIQGKIDQFNNAVQTMWQTDLDDEVIKWLIEAGTAIVKLVDNLGLIKLILIGIGTYVLNKSNIGAMFTSGQQSAEKMKKTLESLDEDVKKAQAAFELQPTKKNQDKRDSAQAIRDDYQKQYNDKLEFIQKQEELNDAYEAAQAEFEEIQFKIADLKLKNDDLIQTHSKLDAEKGAADKALADAEENLRLAQQNGAAQADLVELNNQAWDAANKRYLVDQEVKKQQAEIQQQIETNNQQIEQSNIELETANAKVAELGAKVEDTGRKGSSSFKQLGRGAAAAAKAIGKAVVQMLVMAAITQVVTKAVEWFDSMHESAEEAADAFEELNNELQNTKNELSNLESELDNVKNQIEELESVGVLSFADQEQLDLLKAERVELERQVELKKQLANQQQQSVNSGVSEQVEYYKNKGVKSGKTSAEHLAEGANTGALVGGAVGAMAIGSAVSTASAAVAAGATIGSVLPGIGTAIGAALGLIIAGVAIGAGVGAITAATEDTVGESMDNMQEQYNKLQQEYRDSQANYHKDPTEKNKKKFEEAQKAFTDYQSEMAKYMTDMDAYYSSIDLEAETDPERIKQLRQEMNEFYDTQDKWAITSGSSGAKITALDRIFGKNAEEQLKNIKEKFIAALDAGEEVSIESLFSDEEAFEAFRARMYDMGIYITDVEQYLKDFKEAKDKAFESDDLLGVAKKINGITDAIQGLNNAIEEVNEKGLISADTLTALDEIFGKTESVTDEWNRFIKVMMSGTASTMEMNQATQELAEAWLDEKLMERPMTYAERVVAAAQLEQLGVENASQYVEDANREAVYREIADSAAYDKDDVLDAIRWSKGKDAKKYFEDNWNDMTSEEIQELAEQFGVLKTVSEDTAQAIADKYGVEIDNIDTVISKLEEKAKKEQDYADAVKNQKNYNDWVKSYQYAKQDIETLLSDNKLDSFDASQWTKVTYGAAFGNETKYHNASLGKSISVETYDKLKKAYDDFNKLKEKHADWFNDDGSLKEGVEKEFADAVTAAQNGIAELENELETELTGKTTLELELEITMGKTGAVLDEYASVMETLASIQSEVADGFTISAEKAREFAAVYPEILKGAETTANGQIQLSEDAVNAVLYGERQKQNAAIDTRINELKLQNAEAQSKIEFYRSQIAIAQQAAKSGTDIAWQEAQDKITASNILLGTLINNGVDEETAYQTTTEHMSQDTSQFQEIVAGVSQNNFENMNKAAEGAANSMAINADAMQDSLIAITEQAHEAAKSVAGVANGEVVGSTDKIAGVTYGKSSTMPDFIIEEFTFDGGDLSEKVASAETPDLKALYGDLIDPEAYKTAEEFIAALGVQIDIQNGLIDTNNGLIELLQGYKNNPISSFGDAGKDGHKDTDNDGKNDVDEFKEDMDYWDRQIAAEQAKYEQVQNEIDLLEKQGKKAGADYYRKQQQIEQERLSLLTAKKAQAQEYLNQFDEGTEDWWEAANVLNEIEGEIDEVTMTLQDLSDAIHNLKWDALDELHNRFSDIIGDISDIRDMLSYEDMFDDEGNMTEAGVAMLGAHIDDYRWNKEGAEAIWNGRGNFGDDDYISALSEFINKEYAGYEDHWKSIGIDSEQEYNDKKKELSDYYNEYIKGSKEAEQAVVEMYENQIDAAEEYTSKLIDGYNDYIDACKEALDAERDLHDFKRNVEKQTKDIATLERRIASLSGSTNAADIAERKRLEAELYESKQSLNDTYYDHAKDAQSTALDEEAVAYEAAMNNYVEGLRTTLDEATLNMTTFMEQVVALVSINAETVSSKYNETGLAISKDLTDPWDAAAEAMKTYEGETGLGLMDKWLADGEFFDKFKTDTTSDLKSPWEAGQTAASRFDTKVGEVMASMVGKIQSNVVTAQSELKKVYDEINKINTTDIKVNYNGNVNNSSNNNGQNNTSQNQNKSADQRSAESCRMSKADVMTLQEILNAVFGQKLNLDGKYGMATTRAVRKAQNIIKAKADGKYGPDTRNKMHDYIKNDWLSGFNGSSMYGQAIQQYLKKLPTSYYAKGTIGAPKNHFAITDEPWLGDELVLVPTAQGNLQYMRKGTSVIPAEITKNLVEWGKINPNMASMSGVTQGVNLMSNYINKPEVKLDVENFLRVDRVDKDTLPELEKMMDKKINTFAKQLNYALKRT